jgi:serine/threonine-protein kinase/endoribonuclease IRE1
MIRPEAVDRISIAGVLSAPLFWNAEKSLRFLSDTSDRLEREKNNSKLLFQLEAKREVVGGTDWRLRLETGLQEDLRKFRTYTDGIKDLLRAIRNKRHHQRDLTIQAKKELGSSAESFLSHWTSRFPMLLPVTFEVMCCSYAHDQDPIFDDFYELKTAKTTAKMIERDLVKQKQFPGMIKNFS